MTDRRYRVFVLSTHVIPYGSSLLRLLSRDSRLDILVAYCSMQGAEPGMDPEFGIEIRWDTPLLEGYPWVHVPNRSARPGLGRFFGLYNPGLWKMVRTGGFDAVVIYTGYMYASFWITALAARSRKIPVIISSDSTSLHQREGSRWKSVIKPYVLGWVYRFIDVLMAASQPVKDLAMKLGKRESDIVIIRSGVNKDDWLERLTKFDRQAVRNSWGLKADDLVVFYCAKLQAWKRPLDLVRAFAKANVPDAYLVMAGDGPQREEVESEVAKLGIRDRVRILGFVNDSQLPGAYKAADLFVLPSEYDPCPLVVPEAMFTGLPVLLSDAVLGRLDMIIPGETGYTYRCGDEAALSEHLRQSLQDRAVLQHLKEGVAKRMERWTSEELTNCWVSAVERG
ncbi:MAG TPA: glycosyltransferase family 4 protein, partial [Dongiaceae bacterium]|nr:glycosyltransferase family 4 protein [Dongiaceae bacterium]